MRFSLPARVGAAHRRSLTHDRYAMSPRLQISEDSCTAPAAGAPTAPRTASVACNTPEGYWWARADRRHHPGVGLHPAAAVAAPAARTASGTLLRGRRSTRAVRSILDRQLPDGGFNIYPDGPAEVSATVKAYFALKLAGLACDDPAGRGARAHPGAGRHPGRQQLRQGQPQPVRPLSARVLPVDPARR